MTEPKPTYLVRHIDAAGVEHTDEIPGFADDLANLDALVERANRASMSVEADLAVQDERLSHIAKMIIGRPIITDPKKQAEQVKHDDMLFGAILEEITGVLNDEHNRHEEKNE